MYYKEIYILVYFAANIFEHLYMQEKLTVIYIISDRRSGSTLLENMLSKSREILSVGELAMLKGHIYKEGPGELWNWNCSCGKPVMQCEFWSKVLKGIYDDNFETKITWQYKSVQLLLSSFTSINSKSTLQKLINTKRNKQTVQVLNEVYKALGNISDKKFIVDSSKDPIQALAITKCVDINVKLIWLTRDLRAITFSKLKRWKQNKRSDKKPLETLIDSFRYKKVCNAVIKNVGEKNTIKISYEALAEKPQQQLDNICAKFGLADYQAPEYMELNNDHTIAGTPGRFEKKVIAADNSWKDFYKQHAMLNALGKVFNAL
ncbi:Sulfotransferase family protein [Parafilimonas terrae]|uniref:Sulfotransferase family protein n=2 Tax=Parafilimonas terrae TaxID=1465490 RepID=A0A1I5UUA3_9BACT|nr:Sulfotransferase family protein [Parafilimonas terrae]